MEEQQEQPINVEQIQENLKNYINTRYELTVLKAADKASLLGGYSIYFLLVIVFISMFFILISIAASLYISSLFNSYTYGFLTISGIYLFIAFILIIFRKKLVIQPVQNKLIKQLFEEQP